MAQFHHLTGTGLDRRSIGKERRIKALFLPPRSTQQLLRNIPQQARRIKVAHKQVWHIGLVVERKPLVTDRWPQGPPRRPPHRPLPRTEGRRIALHTLALGHTQAVEPERLFRQELELGQLFGLVFASLFGEQLRLGQQLSGPGQLFTAVGPLSEEMVEHILVAIAVRAEVERIEEQR